MLLLLVGFLFSSQRLLYHKSMCLSSQCPVHWMIFSRERKKKKKLNFSDKKILKIELNSRTHRRSKRSVIGNKNTIIFEFVRLFVLMSLWPHWMRINKMFMFMIYLFYFNVNADCIFWSMNWSHFSVTL